MSNNFSAAGENTHNHVSNLKEIQEGRESATEVACDCANTSVHVNEDYTEKEAGNKKRILILPKQKLTLSEACKSGDVELVKAALIEEHDKINVAVDGWTCLHDVCMRECQFSDITELLLQHGADVNIQDDSGNTPLHIAISYHCLKNIKILLQYNADVNKSNKEGASPIHTAIFLRDNEILEVLGLEPLVLKNKKTHRTKSSEVLSCIPVPENRSPSILKRKANVLDQSLDTVPKKQKVTFLDENCKAELN